MVTLQLLIIVLYNWPEYIGSLNLIYRKKTSGVIYSISRGECNIYPGNMCDANVTEMTKIVTELTNYTIISVHRSDISSIVTKMLFNQLISLPIPTG